jgi:hypothetical protein
MKKYILIVMTLLCTIVSLAQSKQEQKVKAAVDKLTQAMISGNRSELESIVSDQLSYGHSSGHVDDKKSFVEKIASGKSDFVSIDLTEQVIAVSNKTAIVRHMLDAKTNDNNVPGQVHLKVLLVFEKIHGKWILLARQAVKPV